MFFFSETLRKYPALSFIDRICVKKYLVPNTNLFIEQGTQVIIPIKGIHYDQEYYEDPENFNPERFSKENIESRNIYTHMPFGKGPRMCIGGFRKFIKIISKTICFRS